MMSINRDMNRDLSILKTIIDEHNCLSFVADPNFNCVKCPLYPKKENKFIIECAHLSEKNARHHLLTKYTVEDLFEIML